MGHFLKEAEPNLLDEPKLLGCTEDFLDLPAVPIERSDSVSSVDSYKPAKKKRHTERFEQCKNIFSQNGHGSILHTVQMARIFPDSKTFVDMKLKSSPAIVSESFRGLMDSTAQNPSQEAIKQFVDDNFTLDQQLEECLPSDWVESPKLVSKIKDPKYSQFARDLNIRWKDLCRRVKDDVNVHPEMYSLIYLPNPVIVPGGRFREIYYWDSYWIVRGLLLSEMFETVRGMLMNFVHFINNFGMIPNGGRTYYMNRSQPPLFIPMVKEYVEATGDYEFAKQNLMYMMMEFDYWLDNHMVQFKHQDREYSMARYNCEDHGPRPESYFEDVELATNHSSCLEEQSQLYWEIKTGAESGWDYSSRWFIDGKGMNQGSLVNTKARSILPVDLNSFLAMNAFIIADFCQHFLLQPDLGGPPTEATAGQVDFLRSKADFYATIGKNLTAAIDEVLYHEVDGCWYDFDLLNMKPRAYACPTNIVPLWTDTIPAAKKAEVSVRATQYIKESGLRGFKGGMPTTCTRSGEQWDFPNCWPPLEHMVVQGLEKTGLEEAKNLAREFATNRVEGAYATFVKQGHMFEKYDATSSTKAGSGGEYEVQVGFGWSNGVVLDFLDMYATELQAKDSGLEREP